MTCSILLDLIGLFFNFSGAILIAISIGPHPKKDGYQKDDKGGYRYIAWVNHPNLLITGVTLLVIGFLLQVLAIL